MLKKPNRLANKLSPNNHKKRVVFAKNHKINLAQTRSKSFTNFFKSLLVHKKKEMIAKKHLNGAIFRRIHKFDTKKFIETTPKSSSKKAIIEKCDWNYKFNLSCNNT